MDKSRYVMVFHHNNFAKRLYFEGQPGQGQTFAGLVGQISDEAQQYPSAEQAIAFIEGRMSREGFERQAH